MGINKIYLRKARGLTASIMLCWFYRLAYRFVWKQIFLFYRERYRPVLLGVEKMLSGILEPLWEKHDYILIGTCPSLENLTINTLVALNEVIIMVSPASCYDGDAGFSLDCGKDQEIGQFEAGDCGHPDDHIRV